MGKRQRKEELVGYLFIMPVVIGLSVFYIFPFLQNIWFGFNDVNQFNVASFCGADNYVRLLEDKEFLTALANSLKSALVIVPAVVALSLLVASLLNTTIGKGTYIAQNVGIITANHDLMEPDVHQQGKEVILGEKCWIGMNAVILPGVKLGDHTVVGAGSVVTKSFEEGYCVVAGNPGRQIRRL